MDNQQGIFYKLIILQILNFSYGAADQQTKKYL